MNKYIYYLTCLSLLTTFFFSCTRDDENLIKETASLSIGIDLNNGESKKTHLDALPICSEADPAYVEIVLTGQINIGTKEEPQTISIADYDDDEGRPKYITEALELKPGVYSLDKFNVFDNDNNRILISPEVNGIFEQFVINPLPQKIIIDTSEEYFLSVDMVCFDNRTLNE